MIRHSKLFFLFSCILFFFIASPATQECTAQNPDIKSIREYADSVLARAQSMADSILNSMKKNYELELDNNSYRNSSVVVTDFHTEININPEEASFDVTETYHVLFNRSRHGIYRTIPLVYHMHNPLGKDSTDNSGWSEEPEKRRIYIDNIEVEEYNYTTEGNRFTDELKIRIGDEDVYVKGEQTYVVHYQVENAFLFNEDATYFYWDVVGHNWSLPFLNSSFEIHLPGKPELKGYVYTGRTGSTSSIAEFKYRDGIFSGKAKEKLGNREGMTVLLHLPKDYITRPTALEMWWNTFGWILFPPLAFLLFFIAWYFWGRDKNLVDTVEYFPPEKMDPALAGFLVDEDVDTRDITSLIPYWGANGNLRMEVEKSDEKWYDMGIKEWISIGVGGLFLFVSIIFYVVFTMFTDFSGWITFFPILILIPFAITGIAMIVKAFKKAHKSDFTLYHLKDLPDEAKQYEKTIFNELFDGRDSVKLDDLKNSFYTTIANAKSKLLHYTDGMYFTEHSRRNIVITAVVCILTAIIGGLAIAYYMSIWGGALFFLTCVGLAFYSGAMRKRRVTGDETLQKIEGFRMFLKKAKKKEIQMLLQDNPTYFEDTLAYALAFGMVEKYGKKFEGFIKEPPSWYSGVGLTAFSMATFSSSFHSAMRTTGSSIVSRPSSSSGGGGGGGFSGGGFGGGGGGAW